MAGNTLFVIDSEVDEIGPPVLRKSGESTSKLLPSIAAPSGGIGAMPSYVTAPEFKEYAIKKQLREWERDYISLDLLTTSSTALSGLFKSFLGNLIREMERNYESQIEETIRIQDSLKSIEDHVKNIYMVFSYFRPRKFRQRWEDQFQNAL